MSHLIRCLHMHISKIISMIQKCIRSCICLSFIVRMKSSIGSFHQNLIHLRPNCKPFQQVHRRDHNTFLSCLFFKRHQIRPCACSPEPCRIRRIEPLLFSFLIQRMCRQYLITFLHHITEHFIFRQILSDFLRQNVMRRGQLYHFSFLPHKQVAVTRSHIELISFSFQPFLQCFHQNCRVLSTDLAGAVIHHSLFFITAFFFRKRYQITPK